MYSNTQLSISVLLDIPIRNAQCNVVDSTSDWKERAHFAELWASISLKSSIRFLTSAIHSSGVCNKII